MKGISQKQKFWAILGAGLLIAIASGSALAGAKDSPDARAQVVQKGTQLTTMTSPLPTPTKEPKHEVVFTGTVESITSNAWVVGGQTVIITTTTEIKPGLSVGSLVKVEAIMQADGTLLAREIQPIGRDDNNDNHHDDNGHDNGNVNSHDNHGNDHEGSHNGNSIGNRNNGNSTSSHDNGDHASGSNVNSTNSHDGGHHEDSGNVNNHGNQGGEHGGKGN